MRECQKPCKSQINTISCSPVTHQLGQAWCALWKFLLTAPDHLYILQCLPKDSRTICSTRIPGMQVRLNLQFFRSPSFLCADRGDIYSFHSPRSSPSRHNLPEGAGRASSQLPQLSWLHPTDPRDLCVPSVFKGFLTSPSSSEGKSFLLQK